MAPRPKRILPSSTVKWAWLWLIDGGSISRPNFRASSSTMASLSVEPISFVIAAAMNSGVKCALRKAVW